ncbi:MAG TPA: S9 family peptidase [Terracidiphilus sp.]|nr:S9 family peptidase [Terracidiphilus sp.]
MRKPAFALAFVLALALASTALVAQPAMTQSPATGLRRGGGRPMTFNDMMAMKRLGSTAVSPDGRWLAYSVTTVNLDQNTKTAQIYIQPIGSGDAKPPTALTFTQPGDSDPQFAPDGHHILFLSARTGSQQAWIADFDTATGQLSHPRKITNLDTGVDNAIWSPDSASIAFTSFVYPDCPPLAPGDNGVPANCNYQKDTARAQDPVKAQIFTHLFFRHWDHWTGPKRSHLFLVSVAAHDVRDLTPHAVNDVPPFSLEGGGCGCAFSPDSREIAYTLKDVPVPAISTNADIFTLDISRALTPTLNPAPLPAPVKVSTSPGGDFSPAYSPDGKYLAWRSQARSGYESDKFRLVLYDRATKTIKDLMPTFDNWVDEFAWAPDSKSIYFVSGRQGAEPIFQVSQNGQSVAVLNLSDDQDFGDLHVLSDAKTILASGMTVQSPPEVIKFENDQADFINRNTVTAEGIRKGFFPLLLSKKSQLTHLNDSILAKLEMPELEPFLFLAQDKTMLEGFIVKPPHFDPAKKYPVKFLIHGGPQGAWDQSWSYRWNPELFAASGYVVVMINPRGSTGYGQAIIDGVNGDWGGKPFTDLMTGLDYAEQHFPFIDKSRECALGASYGGYMANWILGHTQRFRCIVTHDGMFNPESAYGSTDELWFNQWEFRGKPWDYYGKPDSENPYRRWSPALSAKNFHTPTLVVHSQLDYRLDVSEGFQLFTTLQRLGVPSKMLYFPDEGHWVLKPRNSQLWWKTVNDWVDQWTQPKPTPAH